MRVCDIERITRAEKHFQLFLYASIVSAARLQTPLATVLHALPLPLNAPVGVRCAPVPFAAAAASFEATLCVHGLPETLSLSIWTAQPVDASRELVWPK